MLIDNLEEQGRNLELRWQSSTIRDKCYEAERSFKPTFAEDLFDKDKVKSLRVICASTIRRFGDQIKLDELPYECEILVKYLPKLLTPSSRRKMKLKHCLQITILITLLITDYYQGNEFFPLR